MTFSVPNANLASAAVLSFLVWKDRGVDMSAGESSTYTRSAAASKEKAERETNHDGKTRRACRCSPREGICMFTVWRCYYPPSKSLLLCRMSSEKSLLFSFPVWHSVGCAMTWLFTRGLSGTLQIIQPIVCWPACGLRPAVALCEHWVGVDFAGMWQYQQVWLYNEWRSFFIRILSAPQQFSQSICKELLQMSPCKLTTHFGRKLEGAKTIQEPGWEMVINFLSVSLLKEETIISLSTQQKKRNHDTF